MLLGTRGRSNCDKWQPNSFVSGLNEIKRSNNLFSRFRRHEIQLFTGIITKRKNTIVQHGYQQLFNRCENRPLGKFYQTLAQGSTDRQLFGSLPKPDLWYRGEFKSIAIVYTL